MSVFALEIDDAPGTDILVHLPGTTAWIREALSHGREDELDVEQNDNEAEGQSRAAESKESKESKADDDDDDIAPSKAGTSRRHIDIPSTAPSTRPGGVLVHCQAGMSRSATVVAAFLMRELDLDPVEAVSALREARPVVDPSETFWHQLGLYYRADGKVTLKDRSTRQWYLERTTGAVMSELR
jgi:dual specificity phosphatase 12